MFYKKTVLRWAIRLHLTYILDMSAIRYATTYNCVVEIRTTLVSISDFTVWEKYKPISLCIRTNTPIREI